MIQILKRPAVKIAEVATLLLGCVIAAVLLIGIELIYLFKK